MKLTITLFSLNKLHIKDKELKVRSMNTKLGNSELTLAEVFFQVYQQGKIEHSHRQHLRATLLKENISEEEQTAINRLLYAVRRGWLQIAE